MVRLASWCSLKPIKVANPTLLARTWGCSRSVLKNEYPLDTGIFGRLCWSYETVIFVRQLIALTRPSGNSLRMLMYPTRPTASDPGITHANTHRDFGSVTLLFQTSAGLDVESPSSFLTTRAFMYSRFRPVPGRAGDPTSLKSG